MKRLYYFQFIFFFIVFMSGSFHTYIVVTVLSSLIIGIGIYHLISFSKIYTFGESALPGVCITSLISLCNLGFNRWMNYKIIDAFGY